MEIWDLYDKNRVKLEKTMVRGDEVPDDCFHLVVESVIMNDKNQILIQRRHPKKIGWPNYWEFSCGGSATTGDTSLDAIKREIEEEIGININPDNIMDIIKRSFGNSHYDFYFIRENINIKDTTLQAIEVIDIKWVNFDEVISKLNNDSFVDYSQYGRDHFNYIRRILNEDSN